MIEFLTTKLFIPRPRKNLIARSHLVSRLKAGSDKKLTLISAPAGFGKTTILSEWIPQSSHCVTWFSLDHDDNDPVKFWSYFIKSLQQLRPELGAEAFSLLQSPPAPSTAAILTSLINDIASLPSAFSIVLDDYHVIASAAIHEGLTFLIEHQPANMHLVITTRMDPLLPLARLRAKDQLNELRAHDLRFTADEAALFLNKAMGLSLSVAEINALEVRTEGWIAGLQIAALSMQGHPDVSGFVRTFSGSHRHILGYLAHEVINQQSDRTLSFLLKTSLLERLCGSLCDAVTEDTGGRELLEELERANLFVIPLDEEGRWYRYHHLFAEVLLARLQQSQDEQMPDLHKRASRWLEQNDLIPEAVGHSLAAKDFENAARLIEMVGMAQFGQPIVALSLKGWLAALPNQIIESNPRLLLVLAWQLFVQLDMPASSHAVDKAEQALQQSQSQPEHDGQNLSGAIAAMRAFSNAYTRTPDLDWVLTWAESALTALTPDEVNFRGLAAAAAAAVQLKRGNLVQAEQMFALSVGAGQSAENAYILPAAIFNLTLVMRIRGRWREAISKCRETLEFITNHKAKQFSSVGLIYIAIADLLRETNQISEAQHFVNEGKVYIDRSTYPAYDVFCRIVMAHIKQAQSEWDEALGLLAEVTLLMQKQPGMWYHDLVPAMEAQLQMMRGDLALAGRWAQATNWAEGPLISVATTWEMVWQYEHLRIARAQIFIAQGRATGNVMLLEDTAAYLNRQQTVADAGGLEWFRIKLLILRALCSECLGNAEEASELLEQALLMAEAENYIRIFVDEGEPMRLLLLNFKSSFNLKNKRASDSASPRVLTYLGKLLAAFPRSASSAERMHSLLPEPVSERELEILRLIAEGRSNQEIAETLVIAVSTVKSHINNLYGKLGTSRRTKAISIAREMGLLSE